MTRGIGWPDPVRMRTQNVETAYWLELYLCIYKEPQVGFNSELSNVENCKEVEKVGVLHELDISGERPAVRWRKDHIYLSR